MRSRYFFLSILLIRTLEVSPNHSRVRTLLSNLSTYFLPTFTLEQKDFQYNVFFFFLYLSCFPESFQTVYRNRYYYNKRVGGCSIASKISSEIIALYHKRQIKQLLGTRTSREGGTRTFVLFFCAARFRATHVWKINRYPSRIQNPREKLYPTCSFCSMESTAIRRRSKLRLINHGFYTEL